MKKLLFSLLILAFPLTYAEVSWYPLPPEAYQFGKHYPEAQRLLFAFDYGHALVYEKLLLNRGKISDPEVLERQLLQEVVAILKNPPSVKVDESDIAPNYVYRFPLVINLFDWSHMLHQFILDVLATSEDRGPAMISRINDLVTQYKSNAAIAITDECKTMLFMDGHYFSKSFRRSFPSFNLLIWSYHWFQIKLYEALLKPTKVERDGSVKKVVTEFWALIADLPESADFDMMPETAVEAPTLARLFPTVPAAFDNNHMLHDIVSDLLNSDKVSDQDLRSEGLRMGRLAQDPNAFKSDLCQSKGEP
jgi:hypothetical protein